THGNSLYLPLLHVPLLIVFPSRVPAGMRIAEPVSLRDLPATVVQLIGLKDKARFAGNSLARYWSNSLLAASVDKDALLSEVSYLPRSPAQYPIAKGDMKSLVVYPYHYIKNGDGNEELYDFEKDPSEQDNLALSGAEQPVLIRFRTMLAALVVPKPSGKVAP